MATAELTGYANAAAVIAALDKAGTAIQSDTTGIAGADRVTNIISLTQAEYDAITPDAATVYVIVG
jgi:hypothetical protein